MTKLCRGGGWLLGALMVCALSAAGCADEVTSDGGLGGASGGSPPNGGTSSGGEGGAGAGDMGGGGGEPSLCDEDCSLIDTPACLVAVCNDGSYPGQIGACTVVDDETGTPCDDGLFCTVNDYCDAGACVGGPQNDCGMTPPACSEVTCNEQAQTCSTLPAMDGAPCLASDMCQVNATCQAGQCTGNPKDCTFSPLSECNTVSCNPANGQCEGTADASKNGDACSLTGDLCNVGKSCDNGQCLGGSPKDCSALTAGCVNGVCDAQTGNCMAMPIAAGGMCLEATDACNQGICDNMGSCQPMPINNGMPCNDFDTCTGGDTCSQGTCAGTPVMMCQSYLENNFETCPPPGWTLASDWQCGTPTVTGGPNGAFSGTGVIGTVLAANYTANQSYDTNYAQTPPISLASATQPVLTYQHFVNTEGSTFDGYNVKISVDNGATFSVIPSANVDPDYNLTVNSQPAFGGDLSAQGWVPVYVDLSSYVGQTVILRFSFRTDGSGQDPGVFIDDVQVLEASLVQVAIDNPSLSNAVVDEPYSQGLVIAGGSGNFNFSIVGGTNIAWLSIDPVTGVLSGMPTVGEVGPVSVTVRVEDAGNANNFDEVTYNFEVVQAVFFESFESPCPNGWTLTGEWACGGPMSVGPPAPFSGAQCVGTNLSSAYSNNQAWGTTNATSPMLDLTGTTNPQVSFWVWMHTETCCDGFNVKAGTGGSFSVLPNVMPAYDDNDLNGQTAWVGNKSAQGWQQYTADLSAFAGQMVQFQVAFRSDSSVTNPGVYIDDVLITD